MKVHEVQAGDCFTSIAYENGFFWETLWNHPDNADLKRARGNPFTLVPGDQVVIPDVRPREEVCAVGKAYKFRRRGVPAKLELRLLHQDGTPRANEDYFLEIDGELVSTDKATDGDGKLVEHIPPNAKTARLYLDGGAEVHELSLGRLEPIDTIRGVQARLLSLGLYDGPVDGEEGPALAEAIRRFRVAYEIEDSLDDEAVRAEIVRAHDG